MRRSLALHRLFCVICGGCSQITIDFLAFIVYNTLVKVLFDQLEWEIVRTDEWNCTLEAKFTNTLDKEISYMEIDYKFFDANGNVIDASWTNESNIAPGETRLIKIYPIYSEEGDFASYEIILKEANHYEE